MLENIKKGEKRFNDYKNSVIKEIIKKAKTQSLSEEELSNNRPD